MEETRAALGPSLPASAPAGGSGRHWLVALGIAELVFAAVLLVSALVAVSSLFSAREGPLMGPVSVSPGLERGISFGALVFFRATALFAVLGWGLMRCRRWARSIQQTLFGLLVLEAVVRLPLSLAKAFPSHMLQGVRPGAPDPCPLTLSVPLAIAGLKLAWDLLLPLGLYRALRRPGARAACEAQDPVRRWTDACSPLMITALVVLGLSTLDILLLGQCYFLPAGALFGLGLPHWPLRILLAAGLAALTVGVYRRSRRVAWATLLFLGAGILVGLVRMAYEVAWQQLPGALQAAFEPGSWADRLLALEPWRPLVYMACNLALWLVILITLLPLPRSLAVVEEPETDASHFS